MNAALEMKELLKIELVALVALCCAVIMVALLAFGQTLLSSKTLFSPLESALISGIYAAMWGLIPTILYGAPVYLFLRKGSIDHWRVVLVMGIAPGIFLLIFSIPIGIYAVIVGGVVASVTHYLIKSKRVRVI